MDVSASTGPTVRESIIASALQILQTDGPAALTVRRITDAAGCSTTGVYTHFGGKAGVIEAIFVDGFESFDAAIAAPLDNGDLYEAGRAYRRWAVAHPTQYMVMFGRAVPDFEPSPTALGSATVAFERLVDGVRRVMASDEDDARSMAFHVFATLHGYVMLEVSSMTVPVDDIDARYDAALVGLIPRR